MGWSAARGRLGSRSYLEFAVGPGQESAKMPTYEYECTKCGHVFEMFQNITAKPKRKPDEPCAGCGERAPIRRLLGGGRRG